MGVAKRRDTILGQAEFTSMYVYQKLNSGCQVEQLEVILAVFSIS